MIKYIENKILSYIHGDNIKLKNSKCHNVEPKIKRIYMDGGKYCYMLDCSKCGCGTVVGRFLRTAKKEWNREN